MVSYFFLPPRLMRSRVALRHVACHVVQARPAHPCSPQKLCAGGMRQPSPKHPRSSALLVIRSAMAYYRKARLQGCRSGISHIPPNFVVDQWASDGESSSHRPYLWQYDVWTMFCHRLREEIT
jgi:hypothetical protein